MNRLQLLRIQKGLTVAAVAEATNLSRATVDAAERGARLRAPTIKALADFYELEVTEVMDVEIDRSAA